MVQYLHLGSWRSPIEQLDDFSTGMAVNEPSEWDFDPRGIKSLDNPDARVVLIKEYAT